MAIPLYLAMTAGEFSACTQPPPHMGWLACHFSLSGDGLSNVPSQLPPYSLLIVDDSTPMANHREDVIVQQLSQTANNLSVAGVLLDFQRPGDSRVQALTQAISAELPCPVAVSHHYAQGLSCPVFLPPPPLYKPLDRHIAPYSGREIWLDIAPAWEEITLTPQGFRHTFAEENAFAPGSHWDPSLHCHYAIRTSEEQAHFSLCRTLADLPGLLREAETLGVTCGVGLYQQLG